MARSPLLGAALAASALAALAPRPARADETASTRAAIAARTRDQPHTMVQMGVGLLTLPGADVCLRAGSCTKGDTSVEANIWQMWRANQDFAIGAGATLALRPTTDQFRAGEGGYDRSHTRSYFLVEAQARYYALHLEWVELWMGATVGGVIIGDRYSLTGDNSSQFALLGPRSNTVRTEGGALGILFGGGWTFAPNWSVSANLRYARWFLPETPATTAFGDFATLTGQQGVIDLGLGVAYQIAL